MLLHFWSGVEVLGSLSSFHWSEVGLLGTGMSLPSSFMSLGKVWLSFSKHCDVRLGHVVTGSAWGEESGEDVRCQGGSAWAPKAPAWLQWLLPGSYASPQG